jgi:membrane-bound metal-dependent hydrolase YbcI (DUF457 family)
MLFEHWIYSTAIAIIVGMIYYKRTGRDLSWIIIASAYVPDLDLIADAMFKRIGITVLIRGNPIEHGDFHNIAVLLLFAVLVALLLQTVGTRLRDSFIFASIGFGAHLFEDALVFNLGYSFFWPLSAQTFGIGMVEYSYDWYGIANTEVLIIGLIAVMVCATVRTVYEGNGWVKRMVIPDYFLSGVIR